MTAVCAASYGAPLGIFTPPVKDSVTPQKSMTDNTHRNAHLLIAAVEKHLASISRSRLCTLGRELSNESSMIDLMTAVQIADIEVSRLCLHVQQSQMKYNSESRHKLNIKNIDQMEKALNEAEIAKAAQENRGYWGKLSNILGMAVAAVGVLLAPFTGGASLLATAYLAVDLGLQLGEQISGTKMSIDSGLQIAFKFVLDNMSHMGLSDTQREFYAGIASAVASLILAIGMTLLSAGGSAPKLFTAIKNITKNSAAIKNLSEVLPKHVIAVKNLGAMAPKLSMAVQGASELVSAGAGVTSGKYGLDNASSEKNLNGIDVQRENIRNERQLLLKAFEHCNENMKKIMEQLQRNSSLAGETISRCADTAKRLTQSRQVRYAA
jgi:hypothetical protein